MSKKNFEYAVFIGRLQPLHLRHLDIIYQGLDVANKLIIVLGSARSARNIKNPFTPTEREEMIRACLSKEDNLRVLFRTVRDYYYNDNNWVADVQQKVASICSEKQKICLLGKNKDHTSYYLDLFPQWKRESSYKTDELAATDIRNLYFNREFIFNRASMSDKLNINIIDWMDLWRNRNPELYSKLAEEWTFIQQYKKMWEAAPYPVTFTTTDAIVVKSGHVLVVKRKFNPGKGLIALPGGFLQQNKTVFESAINELKEETRILLPREVIIRSLKDTKVFDHPNRSLRGRTVTHAHYFELPTGGDLPQVKGDDDAEHAFWMPIADAYASEELFYEDHLQMVQYFYGRGQ